MQTEGNYPARRSLSVPPALLIPPALFSPAVSLRDTKALQYVSQ
jgi:hypothetical protein